MGASNVVQGSVASTVGSTNAATHPLRQQLTPLNKSFPLGRIGAPDSRKRQQVEQLLCGRSAMLLTCDGEQLDSVWCSPITANGYAAVVFHGNGTTLDHMAPWAEYYRNQGWHVLLITMRGYPGSSGDSVRDGELGMYCDAAAAVEFLLNQGFPPSYILAHGFSLGGSLAAAAALQHDLGALTLDHTWTKPGDVAVHVTREMTEPWLPEWLVAGAMDGAYRSGDELELGDGTHVVTDGLDNLGKVGQYAGAVFVMYGQWDELMPEDFACRLVEARYPQWAYGDMLPAACTMVPGRHGDVMFYQDPAASSHYTEHLQHRVLGTSGNLYALPETLNVEGFPVLAWGFNGEYDLDPVMARGDPYQAVWKRRSDNLYGVLDIVQSCIGFSPDHGCWVCKSENGHDIASGLDSLTPEGDWDCGLTVSALDTDSTSQCDD